MIIKIKIRDIAPGDRIGVSGKVQETAISKLGNFGVKFESDGWYHWEDHDTIVRVHREKGA